MRGFGGTSRPDEVTAYDMVHLTGDLVGLLDALGLERAVFVGHDWGGLVVWQMPLRHPDRVAGVVGVNTPFLSRLPSPPIELFRMLAGDDHYMVWFQQPGVADQSLGRDIPALFASLMRSGSPPEEVAAASAAMTEGSPFDRLMGGPAMGDPLLSAAEQAVYVEAFTETGFTPGINWYRNMDRNWELAPEQDGARIDGIPCLMLVAEWDPVLVPALAEPMKDLIDDLELHQLARCGHWAPAEQPEELAALVVDWLVRRHSA
jgi:pimeloyl-ACP methyl ester carboxylesterase